jgi:hypothetical protein
MTVWEDALNDGLIQFEGDGPLQQTQVILTPLGRDVLTEGQSPQAPH